MWKLLQINILLYIRLFLTLTPMCAHLSLSYLCLCLPLLSPPLPFRYPYFCQLPFAFTHFSSHLSSSSRHPYTDPSLITLYVPPSPLPSLLTYVPHFSSLPSNTCLFSAPYSPTHTLLSPLPSPLLSFLLYKPAFRLNSFPSQTLLSPFPILPFNITLPSPLKPAPSFSPQPTSPSPLTPASSLPSRPVLSSFPPFSFHTCSSPPSLHLSFPTPWTPVLWLSPPLPSHLHIHPLSPSLTRSRMFTFFAP